MKELSQLNLPENLRYTKDHEWIEQESEICKVGITDFAQDQLGDVVFVELPEENAQFEQGQEFSTLESVKAVSEVYMPVDGEITQVNSSLEESPELVNKDPYTDGWLVEIRVTDLSQLEGLMDRDAYLEMLKGEE